MATDSSRISIRRRLLASTIIILAILLSAGGWALTYMFERHVEHRIVKELLVHLDRLTSTARFSANGRVTIRKRDMAARFRIPYSGLYWQINTQDGQILTSPSLWDTQLQVATKQNGGGEIIEYKVLGPKKHDLFLVRRLVTRQIGGEVYYYQFVVGLTRQEIDEAVQEFSKELAVVLASLALLLVLLVWAQISYGLNPLRQLIPAINAISSGRKRRFSANYPSEVAPLVEQLNTLLENQEVVMERSRARAAGLAHGLKTPLAGISVEIQKLHQPDNIAARNIEKMIAKMNRQVERELIRTRVRGSTHGIRSTNLMAPLARDIIRTLKRLPRGEQVSWSMNIKDDLSVAMDTDDIAEILGNILDNARKWAESEIHIDADKEGDSIILTICDDGRGLRPEQLKKIQERGRRFDETTTGSGLGLTIVHDIVAGYGGAFFACPSETGGLCIRLTLPAA